MHEMMALRAHIRGGAAGLRYEQAPRHGVDRTPIIPSHEVSGVVVDIGTGPADLPLGSPVYGLVPFDRNGAAAQHVAVPASSLALKPPELSDVTAAAAPMTTLTAWQALTTNARCKSGDTVLVHGAAGSVGGLVTQMAKALGGESRWPPGHPAGTAVPTEGRSVRHHCNILCWHRRSCAADQDRRHDL